MIAQILPLISRPSRQGASGIVLPLIAFASVTALLAIVLGGAQTFWGYDDELAPLYWFCAALALVLLIVPLVVTRQRCRQALCQRRDDRLQCSDCSGWHRPLHRAARGGCIEAAGVALVGADRRRAVSYAASPLVGLIIFAASRLAPRA